jgi:hypothetical protein
LGPQDVDRGGGPVDADCCGILEGLVLGESHLGIDQDDGEGGNDENAKGHRL